MVAVFPISGNGTAIHLEALAKKPDSHFFISGENQSPLIHQLILIIFLSKNISLTLSTVHLIDYDPNPRHLLPGLLQSRAENLCF